MIEVVDPTRLRDSLQCLRLYYWRHERHIVPAAPRLPLAYGIGVHATLAEHYRGKTAGLSLKAFEDVWEREVVPFENDMTEEDPKRNPVRWAEVFMLYRQHYANDANDFKVLFVESPFFLPLTEDLAVCGVIDLVIEYLNQKMVMDHKTTWELSQRFFASFNPNHQFSCYLLGATELLEEPVTTLFVNCIKSDPRQMAPEKIFQRVPTTRSEYQHGFMKEELIGWWNVVRMCRDTNNWPRDDDRCQRWPGGCEYHPLCTDIQTDYRKIIPSKIAYRESVWDPIADLRLHGFKEAI